MRRNTHRGTSKFATCLGHILSFASQLLYLAKLRLNSSFVCCGLGQLHAQKKGLSNLSNFNRKKISFALILVVSFAGHSTTPQSYSCRFVCISAYIIAVVIFGTYSATFISFLTVHENKLPYSDLKNLMVRGGYTFGLSSTHAQNYISEVRIL